MQPYLSSIKNACTVPYCFLWSVSLYLIFPHYLINGTIFIKKLSNKNFVLFSSTAFSEIILIIRRI